MDTLHKGIVLVGYSGHSFVVADILTQLGYRIEGYLDKEPAQSNPFSIPYLGFEGNDADLRKIAELLVFPSIGDNRIRQRVSEQLINLGLVCRMQFRQEPMCQVTAKLRRVLWYAKVLVLMLLLK